MAAPPAELRLSLHGHGCRDLRISTVDGQVLSSYRHGNFESYVHRMDEHGAVAETLFFDVGLLVGGSDEGMVMDYTSIGGVYGRWPDLLVLMAVLEDEDFTSGDLHRWMGDGWELVKTPGSSASIVDVWSWHDGSLLAWLDLAEGEVPSKPRLAVVYGKRKGKSLSLDGLRKRTRCTEGGLAVRDVHVQEDGKVLALVSCSGTWLATWTPDDLGGTAQRLSPDDGRGASLHVDARGQGFIRLATGLLAWDGTSAAPVMVPGDRPPEQVFLGRDGVAWILQGRALSRRVVDDWEPVAVPEGAPPTHVAGLEHGTPWLLHEDGTVSMQTADGTWHAVALPPIPGQASVPTATMIHVIGPGDVWVEGTYSWTSKSGKRPASLPALFTTRDAAQPLRCGEAAAGKPASGSGGKEASHPATASGNEAEASTAGGT